MITVRDILVQRARRQGLIRQADLYRLAKQAPTHCLTLPIRFRRLLIRFGELLITLGQQLQASEPAPVLCSSEVRALPAAQQRVRVHTMRIL
jgi:hypothetical protein